MTVAVSIMLAFQMATNGRAWADCSLLSHFLSQAFSSAHLIFVVCLGVMSSDMERRILQAWTILRVVCGNVSCLSRLQCVPGPIVREIVSQGDTIVARTASTEEPYYGRHGYRHYMHYQTRRACRRNYFHSKHKVTRHCHTARYYYKGMSRIMRITNRARHIPQARSAASRLAHSRSTSLGRWQHQAMCMTSVKRLPIS